MFGDGWCAVGEGDVVGMGITGFWSERKGKENEEMGREEKGRGRTRGGLMLFALGPGAPIVLPSYQRAAAVRRSRDLGALARPMPKRG